MGSSVASTHGIKVEVRSFFLPERSDPARRKFVFAYRIRIENEGPAPARLVNRHWIITDGFGKVEEVRGAGVVGQQPRLAPGDVHEYTSFCPLETPIGAMRGTYEMVRDDGSVFHAAIGEFSLECPDEVN